MQDETPVEGPARPTSLAYHASLDGIRGLAVFAILFYHSGLDLIPGGFLSVSTFFTLSGFLITSLLLYERKNTGRIDLMRFWSRRFRRLMPAALTAFLVIAVLGNAIGDASQLARLRWDGIAALFYVSNWRFIYLGNEYADLFASPSLVQHFWSLSIEEQFYLVFPMLTIGLLGWGGRRAVAWVLGGLTVLSTLWMAVLFAPDVPTSRLYFGTDTRAAEFLLGSLLALWHAGRAPLGAAGERSAVAMGVAGIAGTLAFWAWVPEATHWLWQGGFSLYALTTVLAIVGCVQPTGPARRLFSWEPLRWLGQISYGVYLFHFPVYVTITARLTGLELWPLLALRMAVTFALATASFYLLEQPIRQRRMITGWRPWLALPAGVAAACVALVAATIDPPAPDVDLRELTEAERLVEGSGPRILLVGDSVALGVGKGLQRWARTSGRASVSNQARPGCGIARGGRLQDRYKRRGDECDGWPELWERHLDTFDPDVVLVLTGAWDMRARKLPAWRGSRLIGDEVFNSWLSSEFHAAVDLLSSSGAKVVWLTTPCFADYPENAEVWNAERVAELNAVIETLAANRTGEFGVIDLFAEVCPNAQFTNVLYGLGLFRPDGVHFSDAAADRLAEWLAPRVLSMSREVDRRAEPSKRFR